MPPEEKKFACDGPPERLDRFLTRRLATLSRMRVQALIKEGFVDVNGRAEPSRRLLAEGDTVRVRLPEFSALPPAAAASVPVLHEDADVIVVDKPADLVVHPAGPHRRDTLIQRLWPKLAPAWAGLASAAGTAPRPGVVHRLDRGTSGVMVLAKTPAAAEHLSRQFAGRTVEKIYWALVRGVPASRTGHIRSTVGRSRRQPSRMSTSEPGGRWSETEFRVLQSLPAAGPLGAALLEVRPLTGRTHQIRVQMASLGHPLLGDAAYGGDRDQDPVTDAHRPLLHARRLVFHHPRTGKLLSFEAPPPEDFRRAVATLGGSLPDKTRHRAR